MNQPRPPGRTDSHGLQITFHRNSTDRLKLSHSLARLLLHYFCSIQSIALGIYDRKANATSRHNTISFSSQLDPALVCLYLI